MGQIYTVSALTREIKTLIEEKYPFIWITGEISNFMVPASGHSYFSLKDNNAIISGVMFRNQKKRLKFILENGMKITGMGRLSLYEPRGSYQIIFEHIEPEGAGALQVAFEQLKSKLSKEGLFDEECKKPIPFFPSKISVITSGTGAVVRDIINVAKRRFPGVYLEIIPVIVQGNDAEYEIANGLALVNSIDKSELVILARGGGSLEDLAAFNSERVARAVYDSNIPVISAVGHETDFTICDFAADLRAPTPSAAAELALPEKDNLKKHIIQLNLNLVRGLTGNIVFLKENISDLRARLKNPSRIIDDMHFKLEDFEERMRGQVKKIVESKKERLDWFSNALYGHNPGSDISGLKKNMGKLTNRLTLSMGGIIRQCQAENSEKSARLNALSPMAVLERGYSITRGCPEKNILTDSKNSEKGDTIEVLLAKGRLLCQVEKSNGCKKNI